jgi:hypothetical protein
MTYGLYLGLAFSVLVFGFKLAGRIHIPGDGIAIMNTMILTFCMLFFGKRYRDSLPESAFLYRQALGFAVLLSIFSAFIYAFFSYWYYAVIEPQGISYYLDQVQLIYSQQKGLTEEQVNTLIALYRNAFTPGLMAFVIFLMQSFIGTLVGLLVAVFIKTPVHFEKDNY